MRRSPRIFRALTAIGTAGLIAVGLLAAGPASASSTVSGGGLATTVTVLLKAPDQVGLDQLAGAQHLSHAHRVAALAQLLPSPAAHRAVSDTLRSEGFTVTHETAWTIDATAASATVAAVFGTAPKLASNASPAQRVRAAGALPRIPAVLSSRTAAVLPTDIGPKLFRPLATCSGCRNGADFRNAYTPPHVAPTTGLDANGALTIATVQFAGWNDSDLSSYARKVGLPDPVASGQFTEIPVDGASVPPASTQEHQADEEVDLDQEAILSTDPAANQRAYFDTSATKAGYADALSQVLADVTQGTGAVNGGDPKIAALSTSWGTCESEFSDSFAFPHDTVTAIDNILKSLTAAGVTVFAASGDDGIYDCGDYATSTKLAVDYPASSPAVVGVGGSRLRVIGNTSANTGANWVDTAWSCTSAPICQGSSASDTGGSGGGESSLFKRPAYQRAGIASQPFTTSTGKHGNFGTQAYRLVPDIADDGDPDTGFGVLTSDPTDVKSCRTSGPTSPTCEPKTFVVGGTSLSSPEAASLFTDMLGNEGATAGVGDIHNALYSAYARHDRAFRDIKSGHNGRQNDVDKKAAARHGYELPVSAEKGYDTLTGLGAPLWSKIAPYLFTAPSAPTAVGSFTITRQHHPKHSTTLTARWHGRMAATAGSAPSSASVTITREGHSKAIYRNATATAAGSHVLNDVASGHYVLTVTEHDLAGQTTPTIRVVTAVR